MPTPTIKHICSVENLHIVSIPKLSMKCLLRMYAMYNLYKIIRV